MTSFSKAARRPGAVAASRSGSFAHRVFAAMRARMERSVGVSGVGGMQPPPFRVAGRSHPWLPPIAQQSNAGAGNCSTGHATGNNCAAVPRELRYRRERLPTRWLPTWGTVFHISHWPLLSTVWPLSGQSSAMLRLPAVRASVLWAWPVADHICIGGRFRSSTHLHPICWLPRHPQISGTGDIECGLVGSEWRQVHCSYPVTPLQPLDGLAGPVVGSTGPVPVKHGV